MFDIMADLFSKQPILYGSILGLGALGIFVCCCICIGRNL